MQTMFVIRPKECCQTLWPSCCLSVQLKAAQQAGFHAGTSWYHAPRSRLLCVHHLSGPTWLWAGPPGLQGLGHVYEPCWYLPLLLEKRTERVQIMRTTWREHISEIWVKYSGRIRENNTEDVNTRPPHTQSKAVAICKTWTSVPENTGAVQLLKKLLCCVLWQNKTSH